MLSNIKNILSPSSTTSTCVKPTPQLKDSSPSQRAGALFMLNVEEATEQLAAKANDLSPATLPEFPIAISTSSKIAQYIKHSSEAHFAYNFVDPNHIILRHEHDDTYVVIKLDDNAKYGLLRASRNAALEKETLVQKINLKEYLSPTHHADLNENNRSMMELLCKIDDLMQKNYNPFIISPRRLHAEQAHSKREFAILQRVRMKSDIRAGSYSLSGLRNLLTWPGHAEIIWPLDYQPRKWEKIL